jgi:hypothetical protein
MPNVARAKNRAIPESDHWSVSRLENDSRPLDKLQRSSASDSIPLRDIAEVIGRRLNVPAVSKPADHFGFIGPFISIANWYLQLGFSPANWSLTAGAFIGTNSDWRLPARLRSNCYTFSFFAQQSCIFAGGT